MFEPITLVSKRSHAINQARNSSQAQATKHAQSTDLPSTIFALYLILRAPAWCRPSSIPRFCCSSSFVCRLTFPSLLFRDMDREPINHGVERHIFRADACISKVLLQSNVHAWSSPINKKKYGPLFPASSQVHEDTHCIISSLTLFTKLW